MSLVGLPLVRRPGARELEHVSPYVLLGFHQSSFCTACIGLTQGPLAVSACASVPFVRTIRICFTALKASALWLLRRRLHAMHAITVFATVCERLLSIRSNVHCSGALAWLYITFTGLWQ